MDIDLHVRHFTQACYFSLSQVVEECQWSCARAIHMGELNTSNYWRYLHSFYCLKAWYISVRFCAKIHLRSIFCKCPTLYILLLLVMEQGVMNDWDMCYCTPIYVEFQWLPPFFIFLLRFWMTVEKGATFKICCLWKKLAIKEAEVYAPVCISLHSSFWCMYL